MGYYLGWNNLLILTFDPNFLVHRSSELNMFQKCVIMQPWQANNNNNNNNLLASLTVLEKDIVVKHDLWHSKNILSDISDLPILYNH